MARAYSQDLRNRVIDAAFSGKSVWGSRILALVQRRQSFGCAAPERRDSDLPASKGHPCEASWSRTGSFCWG